MNIDPGCAICNEEDGVFMHFHLECYSKHMNARCAESVAAERARCAALVYEYAKTSNTLDLRLIAAIESGDEPKGER